MKSLFEQFGGTYRKESDYAVPNLETPDTGNYEISIWHTHDKSIFVVYQLSYYNSKLPNQI